MSKFVPVFGEYLTSRIVQPEDGRLPYLEENPQDIFALREKAGLPDLMGQKTDPQTRDVWCVPGQLPLIVQLPLDGPWRNIQIIQNEKYVVIYGEYHTSPELLGLMVPF